jgi:hypothetical protein
MQNAATFLANIQNNRPGEVSKTAIAADLLTTAGAFPQRKWHLSVCRHSHRGWVGSMGEGLIATFMLICAILASLGAGVLVAHAICVGLFRLFRTHARQVAAARIAKPQPARLETQSS